MLTAATLGLARAQLNIGNCLNECGDFSKLAGDSAACKEKIGSPACLNDVCAISDTIDSCWRCLGLPQDAIEATKLVCANGGGDFIDRMETGGENGTATASASAAAGAVSSAMGSASLSSGASATGTLVPKASGNSANGWSGTGECASVCRAVTAVMHGEACRVTESLECLLELCGANQVEACYKCSGANAAEMRNLREKCASFNSLRPTSSSDPPSGSDRAPVSTRPPGSTVPFGPADGGPSDSAGTASSNVAAPSAGESQAPSPGPGSNAVRKLPSAVAALLAGPLAAVIF